MFVKDYKSYPLSYVRQFGPKQMVIVYLDRIDLDDMAFFGQFDDILRALRLCAGSCQEEDS